MPSKAWLPVFEPGAEGSAPARSPEAERSDPRHFAGFRRKTESVIVGSYTFAESAAPPSPRAPNATYNTHPRKEAIPWQEMTAWTAPPSATSPEGVSLLTNEGVSQSVSAPELVITMVLFLVVYAFLMVAWARTMGRFIKEGPVAEHEPALEGAAAGKTPKGKAAPSFGDDLAKEGE